MTVVRPSWNQRHRLGQTAQELQAGVYSTHHSTAAWHVRGSFVPEAIGVAWLRLQERHPVLLSSFGADHAAWREQAARPVELVVTAPPGNPAAALVSIESFCDEPFDLARGPLGRLMLAPVSPTEAYLALAVEHLVSDAWSLGVLLRDLAALYTAEVGKRGTPMPPTGKTFVEYAQEQYQYLASPVGTRTLRAHAERIQPVGPIPTMRITGFSGRTPIRYERTRAIQHQVPGSVRDSLARVGRPLGLSALNLAHAALHTGLHRLSGRATVAITLSTANRESPDVSETVGWLSS
jgi:hypothetical protein